MIKDRHGSVVKIVYSCGKHLVDTTEKTLLRCEVTFMPGTEQQSRREKYIFAEDLEAVNNREEVTVEVYNVPCIVLADRRLTNALREASGVVPE